MDLQEFGGVEKVDEIVQQVARRFVRKQAPVEDHDDLLQEGRRIALAALMAAKADGNPAGYLHSAVRKSLGNYISRNLAIVSVGSNWNEARNYQTRASELEAAKLEARDTPETTLINKLRKRTSARWRIDMRRAISRIAGEEDRIIDRLFGIDGLPEQRPDELSRELGMGVHDVYRARSRLVSRARVDLGVYRLNKRFRDEMEGEVE